MSRRGVLRTPAAVWLLLASLVMLAVGVEAAAAQGSAPQISAAPSLIPAFNPQVPNYVVRCDPGQPVRMTVSAPAGVAVAIDDAASHGGSFAADVPVSAGQSFSVVVTADTGVQSYTVRCLPSDFPRWRAKRLGQPQAAWYLVAPCCARQYTAIFDTNGVPVWWLRASRQVDDASLLPDGDVAIGIDAGSRVGPGLSLAAFSEYQLNGTFVRNFTIPGGRATDRHEFEVLGNGDYVVVAHVPRSGVDLRRYGGPAKATVLDALIAEVSPQGKLVWSWNSRAHIKLAASDRWYSDVLSQPARLPNGKPAYDIVHINAVAPYRNGFLVSLRDTDAIYAIAKPSGKVRWKLGGTKTWNSLRIIGDDVPDFGGQHDVRALPDGTITLHDNGTGRGRPPRALRFRINAKARTATLIERLVDHQTPPSSGCCGSARKLSTGDWVIDWGDQRLITEVTPADKPLFDLYFPNEYSYRAEPVFPGVLSRQALNAAMDDLYPRPPN